MGKFRDLTLKRKLFSSLVTFVIIPLLIAGGCFSIWLNHIDKKSSCESGIIILKEVHKDVDKIFYDVEDVTSKLKINSWMQKILLGTATKKDYWELKEWYDSTTRNKEYFSALCLSMDGKIVYQRGKVLHTENKEYIRQMEEVGGKSFWSKPYILDLFPVYKEDKKETVVTYYNGIHPQDDVNAVLSISVPEEALCSAYQPYLNQKSRESFLMDGDGNIISSTTKDELGKTYSRYEQIRDKLKGTEGYFETMFDRERMTVLYTKSDRNGWFLVNEVPTKAILRSNTMYVYLMVLAIVLCVAFGFIFAKVQERFIIRPLDRLLGEMKKLKKGQFDIELVNDSRDEIGTISSEFVQVSKRLEALIQEVYISKIYSQEAELQLLTSQINPHFLYNTLDSIHWLAVKEKDYDVADQLEALSDIFRHVLSRGKEMVSIEEEVNHLKNYMFIMNSRYKNRAKIRIEMDEHLKAVKIPKLIIQPLVENAMLHGLEPKVEGGTIEVCIQRENELLTIIVRDNGVGTDEEKIRKKLADAKEEHNVFALKNLDQRIKLKYGKHYGLHFKSRTGEGTEVRVTMPMQEEGTNEDFNYR